MAVIRKDLGTVTAYAYAVSKGYTGTEAEFAELMASYAEVAEEAAASASAASASSTSAGQAAASAAQSAAAAAQSAASIEGDVQIASQKAAEAQTAAGQAITAKEAAQTAQTGAEAAATNAGQSASTATTKAAEAAQSASSAAQSKTDAKAAAARAEQAAATLTVDSALSDTSTNPVQNKVITESVTQLKSAFEYTDEYLLKDLIDFSSINSVNTGGVNFVVNKLAGTITVTGTAVRNVVLRIKEGIIGYDKIVLRGGAVGGSTLTYALAVYDSDSGRRVGYDVGSEHGTTVNLDSSKTYFIAVVVMNGTTVNGTVFTPRAYYGGAIITLQEQIKKADMRYQHFAGCAFICECGEHIFIDTVNFRLYDKIKQTYTASKSDTTKLAGGYTSANYIHFDGSTFTRSTAFSDDVIAYVYQKMVVPLIDGIIPNYRKIQDGYIRNGSEYYINFDRTPIDALGVYFEPDVKISKRGYIYKSAQAVSYNINDISIAFTLSQNTETIGNKKILMIGDSFVARGYIQNWLHSLESTLQFIGTTTTQHYGYKSEGVSGSRLYYFTDPNTSPFYFNGALDFAQYLSTNNLDEPDYVVINSAINHTAYNNTTYGTYLSNLLALVNMVKAYNPSIKIYVTYGANYAIEPGSTYNYPKLRYIEVRKCCNSVYDVDGITVIPVDSALIDDLDYNSHDIDYLGSSISVLSDCVHPSENVGFRKIANMIYNYLGV